MATVRATPPDSPLWPWKLRVWQFYAAREVPVPALPFAFRFDDAMAMSPALKISAFPRLSVGARISHSGNATPQSGDLVGQLDAVEPGTTGLRLSIDRVQP